MAESEAIFKRIRCLLDKKGMSISRFCKEIGISRRRFYLWEDAGDFPSTFLAKMATVLEVSCDEILGRTNSEKSA